MRASIAILVAVAGCNSVLELRETQLFDAPGPDAAPRCPEDGSPPPFALSLVQPFDQACTSYVISASAGLAVASCRAGSGPFPAEGPIDTRMQALDIDPVPAGLLRFEPTLVPEGDELWVRESNGDSSVNQYVAYRREGLRWTGRRVLPLPAAGTSVLGVPARAPAPGERRVMIRDGMMVRELTEAGVVRHTYDVSALGVVRVNDRLNLSEDGQRLVFAGFRNLQFTLFHTYRADLDRAFGPALPIGSFDNVTDPFLTNDCSRLYFSGLGTTLYVQQR